MRDSLTLNIGDIVYSIQLDSTDFFHIFEAVYADFEGVGQPDIRLNVIQSALPDLEDWELVFDSQVLWSLWRRGIEWSILMQSPSATPPQYQVAIFDQHFANGTIYLRARGTDRVNFPFEHVFAEVLTINLLARGRGVMLHACSVVDGETGRLFAGVSGAGKSTLARLWSSVGGVEILSDDRVIVRAHDGSYCVYGTPWHGDARVVSSRSTPLEQIFILKHGEENRVRRLGPAEAITKLLVRAFPTYWDQDGMDFTLGFLVVA